MFILILLIRVNRIFLFARLAFVIHRNFNVLLPEQRMFYRVSHIQPIDVNGIRVWPSDSIFRPKQSEKKGIKKKNGKDKIRIHIHIHT